MQYKSHWMFAVVVAGLLAAPAGWTSDEAPESRERIEAAAEASKEQAREANEDAARQASEALEAATRLDLDIRLIGPRSVKIAAKR